MNDHGVDTPTASVIIPVLNEEAFIERCVRSLLEQEYPADKLEILVVDGNSEDRTLEILKGLAERHKNVKIVHNPKRIIPAAMNIGIIHAQGEIVLRADAHTLYAHDYVTKCIRTLTESGAANVGGVITPMGEDLKSETIAIAVSSPFGVGNAYYRYANREMFVDTLAFGCWRKSTLVKMGGYREDYLANEDYELNYRLRCAGGKILLSPDIKSYYYSRGSLKALFKQYFRYGKWKVKTLSEHPRSLVFRQVVAPIFVASLLASVCLVPLTPVPLCAVGGSYALANLAFSSRIAWKRGFRYLLVLPQAFFTIHFAWGMGFLNGIRTFVKLKDLRTSGSHCQPHSPHVRKGSLRLQEIEG